MTPLQYLRRPPRGRGLLVEDHCFKAFLDQPVRFSVSVLEGGNESKHEPPPQMFSKLFRLFFFLFFFFLAATVYFQLVVSFHGGVTPALKSAGPHRLPARPRNRKQGSVQQLWDALVEQHLETDPQICTRTGAQMELMNLLHDLKASDGRGVRFLSHVCRLVFYVNSEGNVSVGGTAVKV